MRVRRDLGQLIEKGIRTAQQAGELPPFELPRVVVEKPKESSHGDYASPVAMQLARNARQAPIRIAESIAHFLPPINYIDEITVAPPGFINFRLSESFLQQQVNEILSVGKEYSSFDVGGRVSAIR